MFQATATVVGAANALQQTSIQAASAILDPNAGRDVADAPTREAAAHDGSPRGFRTAFRLEGDRLILVDQRELPRRLHEIECQTGADVAWAIREMVIRGAPAIGQAAAYGLAMTAGRGVELMPFARRATIRTAASTLRSARPTAVNLGWAIDRMLARMEAVGSLDDDGTVIADAMWAEAEAICAEATRDHGLLAEHGAGPPAAPARPCRCGSSPTATPGRSPAASSGRRSASSRRRANAGREIHVYVDETRPYLQGARLTAWELEQAGIPYTLIADGAAGALLASGHDRRGPRRGRPGRRQRRHGEQDRDVSARGAGRPPPACRSTSAPRSARSTSRCRPASAIPIEERPPTEVLEFGGVRVAPPGATVWNPAFDVTPASLISAIVTEEGALLAPFGAALRAAVEAKRARYARWRRPAAATRPDAPRRAPDTDPTPTRRLTDGDRGAPGPARRDRRPDARPTGPSCAASSSATGCSPPTRSATSTTASSPGPAGARAFEGDELVAVALEYAGLSPQPLFVMGSDAGIAVILRDVIRPRAAYVAALPETLPAVAGSYRIDPGPQMVRMWVDRTTFRPYPSEVRRLLPVEIGDLNRLYQLGFASWLPSSAIADGRLLRDARRRPARRRGRDPRRSATRPGSPSSATS